MINIEVADIPFSIKTSNGIDTDKIREHYKPFYTHRKPIFDIDIRIGKIEIPLRKPSFNIQTWAIYYNDNDIFLDFNGRGTAKISFPLNHIDFCITDKKEINLMRYLLPEIIFKLIMSRGEGVMLHGCGIMDEKRSYLFLAPTNGGKSTIAKLRSERTLLNDDRIIVRRSENFLKMHGNPWHGEVKDTCSKNVKIDKIFILKKSNKNKLNQLNKVNAVSELIKNSFPTYWDADGMKFHTDFCAYIAEQIPCYILDFYPDQKIWEFLDNEV